VEEDEPEAPKSLVDMHREKLAKAADADASNEPPASSSRSKAKLAKRAGDDEEEDLDLDRSRLKKAVDAEKKRKNMTEEEAWQNTKKTKTTDVTQEEMEAYRISRQAFEDPMANYQDQDQ
jgi:pre-mRNA-processing factor SLU7